jgi:hypothetical protein
MQGPPLRRPARLRPPPRLSSSKYSRAPSRRSTEARSGAAPRRAAAARPSRRRGPAGVAAHADACLDRPLCVATSLLLLLLLHRTSSSDDDAALPLNSYLLIASAKGCAREPGRRAARCQCAARPVAAPAASYSCGGGLGGSLRLIARGFWGVSASGRSSQLDQGVAEEPRPKKRKHRSRAGRRAAHGVAPEPRSGRAG